MSLPLGRTVSKDCESLRDVLALRSTASTISNADNSGRRFSVTTDVNDERPLEDQSGIVLGPRSAAVLIGSMHLLPRLEEGCSTV